MRLAVMQPYLFPYLGYYQLVNAVDKFVFFDDVNFINKGWINRNQLLQQDGAFRFTLPLIKASQNRIINEIEIADFPKWRSDFLKQIGINYKKAPYFTATFTLLKEFLFTKEYTLIGDLAAGSIELVARMLSLSTQFSFSSELNYKSDQAQDGQDKILRICEITGADSYINAKNGTALYDAAHFHNKNIKLNFISMNEIVYPQFLADKFVPYLSIIDILMFNDIDETKALLNNYTLN